MLELQGQHSPTLLSAGWSRVNKLPLMLAQADDEVGLTLQLRFSCQALNPPTGDISEVQAELQRLELSISNSRSEPFDQEDTMFAIEKAFELHGPVGQ